jgi:hypothetical protein
MMFSGHTLEANIILLGIRGGGKTALKRRFDNKDFTETYTPSVSTDFYITFPKDPKDKEKKINLRIAESTPERINDYSMKHFLASASTIVYVIDPKVMLGLQFAKIVKSLPFVPQGTQLNLVISKADMIEQDDRVLIVAIVNQFIKSMETSKKVNIIPYMISSKDYKDPSLKALLKSVLTYSKPPIQTTLITPRVYPVSYASIFTRPMVLPPMPAASLSLSIEKKARLT